MLVAVFHILDRLVPYQDLGDDWFIRRHSPERHVRKLVNQLAGLGYEVTLNEHAA
jgi:hypothetical protein